MNNSLSVVVEVEYYSMFLKKSKNNKVYVVALLKD